MEWGLGWLSRGPRAVVLRTTLLAAGCITLGELNTRGYPTGFLGHRGIDEYGVSNTCFSSDMFS
jgi:hypothetical protein